MSTPSLPHISIRSSTPADLPILTSILRTVYTIDSYPVEGLDFPDTFLTPRSALASFVAVLEPEQLVGHVLLTPVAPESSLAHAWTKHLESLTSHGGNVENLVSMGRLFVDPSARGRGVGRMLIDRATAWARKEGKELVLEVMSKDEAAIRLYERLGWTRIGVGKYVVGTGEEAKVWDEVFYIEPKG